MVLYMCQLFNDLLLSIAIILTNLENNTPLAFVVDILLFYYYECYNQ